MKASELNKQVQKMSELSSEQRDALLSIIDTKIESDMEKILSRIDANSKEIASISKEMTLRIDSTAKELNTKIDSIKWFLISAFTIIGILITILKFFVV